MPQELSATEQGGPTTMTRLRRRVPEDTEGQTPTPRGTTEPSAFGPLALHAGGQEHPPHRYAATLAKVKVDDGPCNACEHDFTLHAGRQATRKYTFTDREIESVLLSLGKGVSYNRAAASIRGDASDAVAT